MRKYGVRWWYEMGKSWKVMDKKQGLTRNFFEVRLAKKFVADLAFKFGYYFGGV